MKKLLLILTSIFLSINLYASKLTVGASAVPHAEILEKVKPILKKQGIDLKIVVFQDYILPNKALESKDIDANYFQHVQYLNKQIEENKYKFVNAGEIHIEPMGIYSKRYKSINDVKHNDTVIFSNSVSDRSRALLLLQDAGLIKLRARTPNPDISDITANYKNLKFNNNLDPALLARAYNSDEAGLILINTNYALEINLNPTKDSLHIESKDSPYVNIIAVREGDENKPEIKALIQALKSDEIADFINKRYNGAIVHLK